MAQMTHLGQTAAYLAVLHNSLSPAKVSLDLGAKAAIDENSACLAAVLRWMAAWRPPHPAMPVIGY
jgi:hypothetical protein